MEGKLFFNRVFEFCGTIGELNLTKGNYSGVYIIVLPNDFGEIRFKERSNSYRWRGKDPTVSIDELQKKWVDGAEVLYIGKSESKTVQERMLQHIAFWNGEECPAYGGRIIEQIENYKNLEVWYLKCDGPEEMKAQLLKEFFARHKKLPFANLRF